MSKPHILDTNVWIKGSRQATESAPDPCMETCFQFLQELRQNQSAKIVLDMASLSTDQDVPGNSVYRELKNNWRENDFAYGLYWELFNQNRFDFIELTYDGEGPTLPHGIEIRQREADGTSYPFEPNDRKWIALHLNHPDRPTIYYAADSDWDKAREDLEHHNIQTQPLCGSHTSHE